VWWRSGAVQHNLRCWKKLEFSREMEPTDRDQFKSNRELREKVKKLESDIKKLEVTAREEKEYLVNLLHYKEKVNNLLRLQVKNWETECAPVNAANEELLKQQQQESRGRNLVVTAVRAENEAIRQNLLEKDNLVACLYFRIQEMEKKMQESDTTIAQLEATTSDPIIVQENRVREDDFQEEKNIDC
jgi:uncharacterized protein (DUF2344 family)